MEKQKNFVVLRLKDSVTNFTESDLKFYRTMHNVPESTDIAVIRDNLEEVLMVS